MAGSCYKCSICNKTVGQCQICYSASSLKNPWQNMKWKSILWRNHLAGFDNTFFNVQYVTNQLVSVKLVILLYLSEMPGKTWNKSPYYKENSWLDLITHFLNVQYVTNQLLVSNLVFCFISQRPLTKHEMKDQTLKKSHGWIWWYILSMFNV